MQVKREKGKEEIMVIALHYTIKGGYICKCVIYIKIALKYDLDRGSV